MLQMESQACVSDLQGAGAQFTDQATQTPCARETRSRGVPLITQARCASNLNSPL